MQKKNLNCLKIKTSERKHVLAGLGKVNLDLDFNACEVYRDAVRQTKSKIHLCYGAGVIKTHRWNQCLHFCLLGEACQHHGEIH